MVDRGTTVFTNQRMVDRGTTNQGMVDKGTTNQEMVDRGTVLENVTEYSRTLQCNLWNYVEARVQRV